jgi:hypothetical protein
MPFISTNGLEQLFYHFKGKKKIAFFWGGGGAAVAIVSVLRK